MSKNLLHIIKLLLWNFYFIITINVTKNVIHNYKYYKYHTTSTGHISKLLFTTKFSNYFCKHLFSIFCLIDLFFLLFSIGHLILCQLNTQQKNCASKIMQRNIIYLLEILKHFYQYYNLFIIAINCSFLSTNIQYLSSDMLMFFWCDCFNSFRSLKT